MLSTRSLLAMSAITALCATPGAWARPNTNNILITGYWPPTSFMLRSFSTNPASNPGGWQGANFLGSGYNVYSYFPEFPGQVEPNWGRGVGDFEVDYQDTWADWNRITAEVRPAAIITFSRSNTSVGWEIEPAAQRFRLSGEANPPGRTVPLYTTDGFDNNGAAAPNMNFPTDAEFLAEPVGRIRDNNLPMNAIVNAVAAQMTPAQASPFIAPYNPATPNTYDFGGSYLSGYISYLGLRYKDMHSGADDPYRMFAAGHIHVGLGMTVANAESATRITLKTLIEHLNLIIPTKIPRPVYEYPDDGLVAAGPMAVPAPGGVFMAAVSLVLIGGRRRR